MNVSFRRLYQHINNNNSNNTPSLLLGKRRPSIVSPDLSTSHHYHQHRFKNTELNCNTTRMGMGNAGDRSPLFSFGVISDIQYADRPLVVGRQRFELDALTKLNACVRHWKEYQQPLKCVINLGDIIDGHDNHVPSSSSPHKDDIDLQMVLDTFNLLDNVPKYHVLGNHCVWNLGCEHLTKKLGMTSRYYDVSIHEGWRFVFLDGTDMSLMKDSCSPAEAHDYKQANSDRSLEDWNGGIGLKQRLWLQNVVSSAKIKDERLIVFCHWPLVNSWGEEMESSLLWNAHEIIPLLDPEVVYMFMSGHIHENGHMVHNGVHHLTLSGVVNAPVGENAHAIVHIHDDEVEVEGYGTVGPLSRVYKLGSGADM